MDSVVMGLSGGLDSTTLLAFLLEKSPVTKHVHCCTFHYGSTHGPYEQNAAERIIQHYQKKHPGRITHHKIDISGVMAGFKSNLLAHNNEPIPEGHYQEATMKKTVVPGRNMIFTAIMAGIAESIGARYVTLGVHSGDHFIYPDCRPEFVRTMNQAIMVSSEGKVSLYAPFTYDSKRAIVKIGLELGVPYELTRTCYKPQPIACGKCGSCVERLEAFQLNGVEDPLPYASAEHA